MSSTKSLLSSTSDTVSHDDVERSAYLKKMKTMKKKYFVLRREGPKLPARLEYYDTEKKFKSGQQPKRSIVLKKCFNINRRVDTRVKHCLALYTKDDCFCLVLESAEDASDWLKSLLELQHGGATEPGEVPKPAFEFVWQVKVQEKGLGATYNILGPYRVCLTSKSLSLLKMGCKDETEEEKHTYEFSLASVRRCGSSQCFFYMEVGRSSVTGAGELWMVTEDQHIATHMHSAIIQAMSGGSKEGGKPEIPEELGPKPRNRSCSHSEVSKPVGIQRRATHAADSGYVSSSAVNPAIPICDSAASLQSSSHTASPAAHEHHVGGTNIRDRCDSLPCAPRTRTTSEGLFLPTGSAPHHPRLLGQHSGHHNFLSPAARPHSMYARGLSHSPPIDCSPVSPVSGGCSTDSAGSSLSIDETDGSNWLENLHHHHQAQRSLTDSVGGSTPPSRCGLDNGRYVPQPLSPDDSIPGSILEENSPSEYLLWATHISEEEQQEYMPMERQSSANLTLPLSSRTNNNNNNNKYKPASPSQGSYLEMSSPVGSSPLESAGRYMMMSPGTTDVTPQATAPSSFPRSSGLYMSSSGAGSACHSRTSSLAEDCALGYVPMAPGHVGSEVTHLDDFAIHRDDGYVDMEHSRGESPGGSSCSLTSGTPSMTHTGEHGHHFSSEFHLEKVSSYFTPSEDDDDGGSGTSGSLPRQQDGPQPRPTRAYSLGSRPDSVAARRHRLDIIHQEEIAPSRARACSMGAQQRPVSRSPAQPRHHSPVPVSSRQRASTGPFLSSSWSGSGCAAVRVPRRSQPTRAHPHASQEPISTQDNLMELDFSKHTSTEFLDKTTTSPIFEEYVDMRRKPSKPIDLPKKSTILPLWGASRHDVERVSPNRGSPGRGQSGGSPGRGQSGGSPGRGGNSDDYLNMQGGHRSQPINIAASHNSASKSSTSPVMFSLSGLLSRKSSSGTGTPPKLPDRSNSPSPFSSLRRRGKKNSKKNKDKRSSISSDDTSNVTTPVGVFPFSPSTPSKSFVPEEQFAKCSIDSAGVRLQEEPSTAQQAYTNYAPMPDPEFLARLKAEADSSKRKVSSALRPPILGQSGGKTVVIGQEGASVTRQRNSASECEYVPMHPSSRRKYSDVAGYAEARALDRKCASDNVLLESSSSEYALMTPERVQRRLESQDYAIMKPGDTSVLDYTSFRTQNNARSSEITSIPNDDYALMQPGCSSENQQPINEDYAMMTGRPTERRLSSQEANGSEDYSLMTLGTLQPQEEKSNSTRSANISPNLTLESKPNEDYAVMTPGMSNTPPKLIKTTQEPISNMEDYALMAPGVVKTPPKIIKAANLLSKSPQTVNIPPKSPQAVDITPKAVKSNEDYALMSPAVSKTPPKVIKAPPPLKSSEDYAIMSPGTSNTPPKIIKAPTATKSNDEYAMMTPSVSRTPPKFTSMFHGDGEGFCSERKLETLPEHVDCGDYALLDPQKTTKLQNPSPVDEYALMVPGDGNMSPRLVDNEAPSKPIVIKKSSEESDYALMKPGEKIIEYESKFKCVQSIDKPDCGDYATLAPVGKSEGVAGKSGNSDYALMTPGKPSEEKSVKEKKNSEQRSSFKSKPSVKSKSPGKDDKLNVKPAAKERSPAREDSDEYVLMTPAIKPPMLPQAPISLHLNNPSTAQSPLVVSPISKPVPEATVPVSLIPSLSVTAKSNPGVTRSSSIPLPSKPAHSTPIHIPKPRNCVNKSKTLPKPLTKSNSNPSVPRQTVNKQKTVNKNTGKARRSTSKSPLPTPELNYASLDLKQSQETEEATPGLARNLSSDSSCESDVTSIGTTYAQIDFVRTQQQQQQNKKLPD